MSEDLKWLHRQNRAVRCKKHGLHFDPKVARGCYLCLKEAPRRATPPKFLLLLLAVLGMSFALFQILGKKPPPADDNLGIRGLPMDSGEDDGGLLNPEAFQSTLQTFENALFGSGQSGREQAQSRQRIEATGRTLILEVSKSASKSVETFGTDLEKFLASVSAQEMSSERQGKLQKAWVKIRQRYFEDASWLAKSAGGSSSSRPGISQYRTASADLEAFLRDSLRDAEDLIASGDSNGWKSFSDRFRGRYNTLAEGKPPRPRATADAQLLRAYQSFESALRDSRSLAKLTKPPPDIRQFSRALEAAENARRAFEQARQ